MAWPDPNTLTYWGAIFALIVAIGTILGWFKQPLVRWFQSRPKGKVRQRGISLSFVSNDRYCHWSEAKGNDQSGTFVNGHWHVTNISKSDVMILKARLGKYATRFVDVRTHHPEDERFIFGDYPIQSGRMSEVSVDFTFFPPIGRAPEPIISDVIFTDNFGNEYRVPAKFSFVGLKP